METTLFCSACGAGTDARQPKRPRLDEIPESATVNKLLRMIGRGSAHVGVAADIARTVLQDGFQNQALKALSSCGAGGACPQNTERDLHVWLRGLWGLKLEPYCFSMDLPVNVS